MTPIPFRWINISFGEWTTLPDPDTIITAITTLRCHWVRLECDFLRPLPTDYLHKICDWLVWAWVRIMAVLLPLIPWKVKHLLFWDRDDTYCYERHSDKFLAFCYETTRLIDTYVSVRQLWNEQNTRRFWWKRPQPEQFARCVSDVFSHCSHVTGKKWIAGSIMGNDTTHLSRCQTPFHAHKVYECLDQENRNRLCARAIQPYFPQCYIWRSHKNKYISRFIWLVQEARDLALSKSLPLWITERGISKKWTALSDNDIADVYAQALKFCASHQMPFFVWSLFSTTFPRMMPWNPEHYFGLMNMDGTWTSLGHTVVQTMAQYSDAST